LSVSHDSTISSVNTREVTAIPVAGLESSVLSVARSIEGAADTIKSVSAPGSIIGSCRVTNLYAELITTHKAGKKEFNTMMQWLLRT